MSKPSLSTRIAIIVSKRRPLFAVGASAALSISLAATTHHSIKASLKVDDFSAAVQSQGACNTSFPSQRQVRVNLQADNWSLSLNWNFILKDNNYPTIQAHESVYRHNDCLIAVSPADD